MPAIPKRPPKLPGDLLTATVISGIGDSITANVGTYPNMTSNGFLGWLVLALQGKASYYGRAGTGGFTTTQILATMVDEMLAIRPKPTICTVLAGTNDYTNGINAATTVANLTAIYRTLRANGIMPICISLLPRNDASAFDDIAIINTWIAGHARQHGYWYVDAHSQVVDPDTGNWLAGYTSDGVHPTAIGCKVIGEYIATKIAGFLPPFEPPLSTHDVDSGNKFVASLFKAGFTDANGDSLPDTTVSQIGWAFFGGQADTTVSYAADPGVIPGRWLKLTRSGASAGLDIRSGVHGASDGDVLGLGMTVKVTDMGAGNSITVWLAKSNSTVTSNDHVMSLWTIDGGPYRFYKELTVPAWSGAGVRVNITMSGPAGPTLWIAQPTLRNLTAFGVA